MVQLDNKFVRDSSSPYHDLNGSFTLSASWNSLPISMRNADGISVQIAWGGAGVGTFSLQTSNMVSSIKDGEYFVRSGGLYVAADNFDSWDWTDVEETEVDTADGSPLSINFHDMNDLHVRLKYVRTSGSLTSVRACFNVKG